MVEIPGLEQNRLRNVCNQGHLSLVVLFGSYSRGRADKNSDLDLAILVDKKSINDATEPISTFHFKLKAPRKEAF
jgi:predicted nucleotidyltransferase